MNSNRTRVLVSSLGGALLVTALISGAGAATRDASAYKVRVTDSTGAVLTGAVRIYGSTGSVIAHTTTAPDGTFTMMGDPTQKYAVSVGRSNSIRAGASVTPVVLPSSPDSIVNVKMADVVAAPSDSDSSRRTRGGTVSVGGATCDVATDIALLPFTDSGTTGGGVPDPDDQSCGGVFNPGAVRWYKVTGNGNKFRATTCVGSGDTTLEVYLACGATPCDGGLSCVAGNDDFGCGPVGFSSQIDWDTTNGAEYYVPVGGFGGALTSYTLTVSDLATPAAGAQQCTGACCTCLNAPFNCQVETAAQCDALGANYQGDAIGCCTPLGGAPTLFAATGLPAAMPAGGTGSVTITVPAGTGLAADLDVQIDLNHSFNGGLSMDESHGGKTVNMWDFRCGWPNFHATADDTGTETFCAPISVGPSNVVHYAQPIASRAGNNLNTFDCATADGDWKLSVQDTWGESASVTGYTIAIPVASATCLPSAPCGPSSGPTSIR